MTNRHEHHGPLQEALAAHLVEHHGLTREIVDQLGSVVILDGLHRGYHVEEEIAASPREVDGTTWVRLSFDTPSAAVRFMENLGFLKQTHEFAGGITAANIQNDEWTWR